MVAGSNADGDPGSGTGLPLGVLNLAKIKPYQRGFFCNDDSIKYPFHDSTITSTVLYTVGFTLPIFSLPPANSEANPCLFKRSKLNLLCVLLAGLPFAILNSRRIPFQRGVFCSDESIQYPYKEDTISYKLLAGIIIPFSVIVMILGETLSVFYNHLHSNSFVRNNYIATIYKAIGTFIFGAAASQSLTDIAKYSIGRLRPHFLAVCQPDWTRINCSLGYIENFSCQGDKAKINEGR
nr:PREDICTED: lipid phosphate phosphohydrolase 1-like [Haliaeetus albicilla]